MPAARQFERGAAAHLFESGRPQGPVHALAHLILVQAEVAWPEGNLLPDRQAEELRRGVLEDQADTGGQAGHWGERRIQPRDAHTSFDLGGDHGWNQPGQHARQRALATPRGATDQDELPRGDAERDSVEDGLRTVADEEPLERDHRASGRLEVAPVKWASNRCRALASPTSTSAAWGQRVCACSSKPGRTTTSARS